MTRIKKLSGILLLLIIIIGSIGCGPISTYQKSIYDDDSKIVKQADSFTFMLKNGSVDNSTADIKFKSFDGSDTLWKINAKSDDKLTINSDNNITKGKFKVVLIDADGKASTLFENTVKQSKTLDIQKGKNRIKIIGSGASGQINITLKGDENINITSENDF